MYCYRHPNICPLYPAAHNLMSGWGIVELQSSNEAHGWRHHVCEFLSSRNWKRTTWWMDGVCIEKHTRKYQNRLGTFRDGSMSNRTYSRNHIRMSLNLNILYVRDHMLFSIAIILLMFIIYLVSLAAVFKKVNGLNIWSEFILSSITQSFSLSKLVHVSNHLHIDYK